MKRRGERDYREAYCHDRHLATREVVGWVRPNEEPSIHSVEGKPAIMVWGSGRSEDSSAAPEHSRHRPKDLRRRSDDSTDPPEHAARRLEDSGRRVEHSTSRSEDSTARLDHSASRTEHSISDPEHSTSRVEHSISRLEHSGAVIFRSRPLLATAGTRVLYGTGGFALAPRFYGANASGHRTTIAISISPAGNVARNCASF